MKSEEIFTGERFVPGIHDRKLEIEHYQRYLSVRKLAEENVFLMLHVAKVTEVIYWQRQPEK